MYKVIYIILSVFLLISTTINIEMSPEQKGETVSLQVNLFNSAMAQESGGDGDDPIEVIDVSGTRLHDTSVYATIGVYYGFPSANSAMGLPSAFENEYMRVTYYSHCMSAAMSGKPDFEQNARDDIETLYEVCMAGTVTLTGVWSVYFSPYVGLSAGLISATACSITSNDAFDEVDSFCEAAVDDLRGECAAKYYGS